MKRILITGGRKYNDVYKVFKTLNDVRSAYISILIIQGGASGADALAKEWALSAGVPCIQMDAAWKGLGMKAGSVRNAWMLEYCSPDFVIAFPGGVGTADMKTRARAKGLEVYEV